MTQPRSPVIEHLRKLILQRFEELHDPRVQGRCKYELLDVVVVSFLAMVCGFQNYSDMHFFCATRFSWLRRYLNLSSGIPSHDTFRRILGLILPEELEGILRGWAAEYARNHQLPGRRIIIDGKSLRGTQRRGNRGKMPLHLVHAFDSEHEIVLVQKKAGGTGISEHSAALDCIDHMFLKAALVSLDAGLSYKSVTDRLIQKKAHYIVPIKSNESQLFELFESNPSAFKRVKKRCTHYDYTEDHKHGRDERRECVVSKSNELLKSTQKLRPEIKTIFQITRYRQQEDLRPLIQTTGKDGKQTYKRNDHPKRKRKRKESVYYISSKSLTAAECLKYVREHWGIENKLHWRLDVIYDEDACRVRNKQAARNLSTLRKLAFNVFSAVGEPSFEYAGKQKPSRKTKMKIAALDEVYLQKVIQVLAQPQLDA